MDPQIAYTEPDITILIVADDPLKLVQHITNCEIRMDLQYLTSFQNAEYLLEFITITGYEFMNHLQYRTSHVIVLCFNVDLPETFVTVEQKWFPDIKRATPNKPIIFVGLGSESRTDQLTIESLKFKGQAPVSEFEARKLCSRFGALNYRDYSFIDRVSATGILEDIISVATGKQPTKTFSTIPYDEIKMSAKIGEGGFGVVYLGNLRSKEEQVAIKRLKNSAMNFSPDAIVNEAKALAALWMEQHIVQLYGITHDPTTNEVVIIMEFMKDGSLEDLIVSRALTRSNAIQILQDVAQGLKCLHLANPKIVHRDLKCSNVLLYNEKKRAKISDFGTARFLNKNSVANTVVGTFCYAAPELFEEKPYNEKVDIYSFGVLMYHTLSRTHLPIFFSEKERTKKIVEEITDKEFQKLIVKCCKQDPKKRPTIIECIEHLKKMKK